MIHVNLFQYSIIIMKQFNLFIATTVQGMKMKTYLSTHDFMIHPYTTVEYKYFFIEYKTIVNIIIKD